MVQYVENKGVQTRMLFAGNLTKHPCFDEMRKTKEGYRIVGDLAVTDRIMKDTFWVGVYPGMTDEMIDYMAKTIKEALTQARNAGLKKTGQRGEIHGTLGSDKGSRGQFKAFKGD